jgi:small subunit ribosomal protein S29
MDNKLSFNSGLMLYGDAGTGKSGVLNYVISWAHQKNWVVMKVRNCFHITHPHDLLGKDEEISMHPLEKHLESRLFLDYVNSGRILKDFMTANEDLLRQIPVDKSLYGKINIVGVHDGEPTAVPNAYNAWRKFNFYDSDKFMLDFEIEELGERNRKFKTRLGEALPEPETLWDICEFSAK